MLVGDWDLKVITSFLLPNLWVAAECIHLTEIPFRNLILFNFYLDNALNHYLPTWRSIDEFEISLQGVISNRSFGNCLVVQWLGLRTFTAMAWVWSLVTGELRSHRAHSTEKEKKNTKGKNELCSKNLKTWVPILDLPLISLCACAKSLQPCLTLCHSMDHSPSDSSVHGILQARILEWVDMPSSRESSQPRDWTHIS